MNFQPLDDANCWNRIMAMTANRSMLGDGVVNCGGRVVFLLPLSRLVSGNLPCHEVVADCSKLWWMIAVLETL